MIRRSRVVLNAIALGLGLYLLLDAVEDRVCRWTRTA